LFIFLFGMLFLISLMIDSKPTISANSYIYLPLSGIVSDYTPPDPLENYFGYQNIDQKKIRDIFEKAAVDDRINGIILKIGFLQIGYGKLQELHEIISRYRSSGKKIYAYLETGLTKEYYLALACDTICMPPNGNLFLSGLNSELVFYKDFFKKIGVEAEFVHVGKYKSAPEMFTNNEISDPHREELHNLIEQYYLNILRTISSNRHLDIAYIDSLINNVTAFSGNQAKDFGLIDETCYIDDLTINLKVTNRPPTKVIASTYANIPASSLKIRNRSNIAIIHINGTIASGADSNDPILGNISGANSVVRNLERASSSRIIKAIILRIDSPGGSATASDLIFNAVKKAAEKKPVIASVADYGASGGYMIALGADSIVAQENSLLGSIGIFAGKFNIQNLYKKLGINTNRISKGENAGLFSIYQPWSESERTIIEKLITEYYRYFIETVARERGLTIESVKKIAEGRVWTGEEAAQHGMIDQIGTLYDALRIAKEKAGIDEEHSVRLMYYPKERSLFDEIFNYIKITTTVGSAFFTDELQNVKNIQNKPLALLPFKISWN